MSDAPSSPMPPLTSLADVRAFVAVVEQGSFSAAAAQLGLSQPTVSQRVQALEQHCALRLIDRRNGVVLTNAGRTLYNHARMLLGRAQEFDAAARDIALLRAGRLVVGYAPPHFAMPVAAAFMQRYAGVELNFRSGNTDALIAALEACTVDVAVLTLAQPRPGLVSHLLVRQRPVLCVPIDHPFAARGRVQLADLSGHAVVSREMGSQTRVLFEASCVAHGVIPGRFIEVPTREAVKEAAAAGLGLGVVLDREAGDDRRLATVEIADIDLAAGTYVVCLEETRRLPAVNAFFEVCATLFPSDSAAMPPEVASSQ